MAYMNQPQDLHRIYTDLDSRLRKLETAVRFTAPDVATVPTYPRIGDIVYDNTTDQMKYWNGSVWIVFADNSLGVPVITYTPTWAGTGLAFTGTPAVGRYSRVGKMITYNIQVNCATVTNFGTGQYTMTLPTGLPSGYSFQHLGGLHKASSHFTLLADLGAGSTTITMYHPAANGSQDTFDHNKPTTLTTACTWYFSGTYFLA
jgi:hypothetical protein